MKKITFDTVFKTIIMVSLVYSLYLLTIIANNSNNGRYQSAQTLFKLDTKTGTIYYFVNDTPKELKIGETPKNE